MIYTQVVGALDRVHDVHHFGLSGARRILHLGGKASRLCHRNLKLYAQIGCRLSRTTQYSLGAHALAA